MSEQKFVRMEERGDALVVSPLMAFGNLVDPEVAREWKLVLDRLDSPTFKRLVVDLGELPYFGSTVLDWLVQLWNRMKAKGGTMAACNISRVGREVLGLARLDTLWRLFNTRDEALAALRTPDPLQSSPSQGQTSGS
ncbi:MAG TPA: STAS domain-containing protein [Pirellulaceae bacterium]|jgi:anti-sigma B factor antagonist|nr:STAS domain-containing protein [Pirellulaceae bacterium]